MSEVIKMENISSSEPAYKRWSGETAHKKIKEFIDTLDDADVDKFREFYEELGEDYDLASRYKLYDIVNEIEHGKSMDAALERNRLFKGEDSSVLKKHKPKISSDPIIF